MITEDIVSFEVAKLLKQKGFPQEYDKFNAKVYNEEDYEQEYEVQRMVLQTRLVKAGTLSNYPVSVPEPKCYAPTLQMAMKWLREVHNLQVSAEVFTDSAEDADSNTVDEWYFWDYIIYSIFGEAIYEHQEEVTGYGVEPDTYEGAVEEAIKYCLIKLIN